MPGAFTFVERHGIATEDAYPYTAVAGAPGSCTAALPVVTTGGYVDVTAGDETALQDAVAQQPVSVAIEGAPATRPRLFTLLSDVTGCVDFLLCAQRIKACSSCTRVVCSTTRRAARHSTTGCWSLVMAVTVAQSTGPSRTAGAARGVSGGTSAWRAVWTSVASRATRLTRLVLTRFGRCLLSTEEHSTPAPVEKES